MHLLKTDLLVALLSAAIVAATSHAILPRGCAWLACGLGWTMAAIALVDWREFRIPDMLSLPAIPAGLLATGWIYPGAPDDTIDRLIGAAVGGGGLWALRAAYRRYRGREGLGLGDVKLAAAAGAWTGLEGVSQVLLVASFSALACVAAAMWIGRRDIQATDRLAFGVFLAPAIWIVFAANLYLHPPAI
jgi:leader peptidase (prepilin peptidase) / N-methyltransferase